MSRRRKNTGPAKAVAALVHDRDDGACIVCGLCGHSAFPPHTQHHRRPRGAGSSRLPDTNSPANLVTLCHTHHLQVESHREDALEAGWLVRQGHDPALTPVIYHGRHVLLTHDGQIEDVA